MAGDSTARRTRASKLRHELRTPINQIVGYAEMLIEDAPEELRPDLEKIRAAAMSQLASVEEALGLIADDPAPESALPAAAESCAAEQTGDGEPVPEGDDDEEAAAAGGARLLLVDDEERNRDMLARRLRRRGFAIDEAADGPSALAALGRRAYDLVLLDIMMPGMSGLEVLERIRQGSSMSELPVIMATARDGSADVVQALAAGANDYVTKPINLPVVVARIDTQLEVRRAHRFIRAVFGRYLTDEVVENLLGTPGGLVLGGENRTVTVLMSDLRGFSSISERLAPTQVIALLNGYLGVMTEIIRRHGGTIDEFIGDAILVVFGAPTQRPDDARRAVTCAVAMQKAMEEVNARSALLGLPAVEMGIGLNTGEVVVGNIGSERRAKYGVVGRHVNLASRVQAYTIGGQILAAEATVAAAGEGVRVDGSLEVHPKGALRPMRLLDVGGIEALQLARRSAELVPLASPLDVRFGLLDGVQVSDVDHEGRVTHLSAREARLVAPVKVGALKMVKLVFPGGEPTAGDAYAKVLRAEPDGGSLLVHFTWIAPGVEGRIARWIAGG